MLPEHIRQNNYMYTSIYDVIFSAWYQILSSKITMGQSVFVLNIVSWFLVAYPLLPTPIAKFHQEKYKPYVAKKRRLRYQRNVIINNHGESKIEKWFDEERQRMFSQWINQQCSPVKWPIWKCKELKARCKISMHDLIKNTMLKKSSITIEVL